MKEKVLSEKSNKTLNGLSKAIEIVSKIVRVFVMIGIVCVALLTVVLGFMFSKVKISGNEIKVKGVKEKIVFVEKENGVALKIGDEESETFNIKISEVNKFLRENSVAKLATFTEVSLLIAIAYMFLTYLILGRIIKIFKNVRTVSPFTEDNIKHIKKIGYYLIAIVAISFLKNLISALLFDSTTSSFNAPSIMTILFVFTISYIFEYGYKLEKEKSKIKE